MSSTKMNVRVAARADALALTKLNSEFNGAETTVKRVTASLLRQKNTETVIVGEIDGNVVAFACLHVNRSFCYAGPWGELTEMYVQAPHRRRGLGRAMLAFAEETAKGKGATEMLILTGRSNRAGKTLYRSMGYVPREHIPFSKNLRSSSSTRKRIAD